MTTPDIDDHALTDLVAFLDHLVELGHQFGGGQVYLSLDGTPLIDHTFGTDGTGAPFESDSVTSIYCCGKPLVALVFGSLVADGAVTIDSTVGEVLGTERAGRWAGHSFADVLSHRAGLLAPIGAAAVLTARADLDAAVASSGPPPDFAFGAERLYSEYAAWHLVGITIEQLLGCDYREAIRNRVLDPLGLTEEFVVATDEDTWMSALARIRVNESFRGGERFPMLLERTALWGARWNPAFGHFGSARGLGRFYERLHEVLSGARPDHWALDQLTTQVGAPAWDRVLGRECSFSSGFMYDLVSHRFGPFWGPRSIGHSGNVGMTAVGLDPDTGLVVSTLMSGLSDGETAVHWFRPALMKKIHACLTDSPQAAVSGADG